MLMLLSKAQAKRIIEDLVYEGQCFDSHVFINLYRLAYPIDYYEMTRHAVGDWEQLRDIHSQIANFLRYNQTELGITRVNENAETVNANVNMSSNAVWQRV